MKTFKEWLENASTLNNPHLAIGGGNDHLDTNNDDYDGDDDDYENGFWGWNKMKSLNLTLFDWAKKSSATKAVGQIFNKYLFGNKPQNQEIRVFPGHVQVELEWIVNIEKWSNFDNEIESILKKSDLFKPLGIQQEQLWNVVDKGAVYDYMLYVLIITLTGRSAGRSYMDNQASFQTWDYIKKNQPQLEQIIKQYIQEFYDENNLGKADVILNFNSRGTEKPTGVSQSIKGQELWAKGIASVPYTNKTPANHNPETWTDWGNGIQFNL